MKRTVLYAKDINAECVFDFIIDSRFGWWNQNERIKFFPFCYKCI